jgi:hypothetical protein
MAPEFASRIVKAAGLQTNRVQHTHEQVNAIMDIANLNFGENLIVQAGV